jgi:hypothetical protein
MTSYLFIPTTFDARSGRRVDFANMASLFAVPDEAPIARQPKDTRTRVLASLLILLCALGDTMLIARPDTLMSCLSSSHASDVRPPARS